MILLDPPVYGDGSICTKAATDVQTFLAQRRMAERCGIRDVQPFLEEYDVSEPALARMFRFFGHLNTYSDESQSGPIGATLGELLSFLCQRYVNRRLGGNSLSPSASGIHGTMKSAAVFQETLFAYFFGKGSPSIGHALDCFASGSLTFTSAPLISALAEYAYDPCDDTGFRPHFHGPDGAQFFCWLEFALLAAEHRMGSWNVSDWCFIAQRLLRATHIFARTHALLKADQSGPQDSWKASDYEMGRYKPIEPYLVNDVYPLTDAPMTLDTLEREAGSVLTFAIPSTEQLHCD